MADIKVNGIVIKVHQARESDLVVRLLTAELGKISAIAKGARRSKKRFSAGLDLFDHGVFSISRVKKASSDLYLLNDLLPNPGYQRIRLDLDKLASASTLCEVYDLLLPENVESEDQIYHNLDHGLAAIEHAASPQETLRYCFICLSNFLKLSGLLDDRQAKEPSAGAMRVLLNQIEHYAGKKLFSREALERTVKNLISDSRSQNHNRPS